MASLPTADTLAIYLYGQLDATVTGDEAVVVALSGGIDSITLLHLTAAWGSARGHDVSAVHVHHHLSSYADDWVACCERACDALSVPLTVRHVTVAASGGGNIEARARKARYAAFATLFTDTAGVLCTAHHADDQAETLLLRLLRGAGTTGAAAMRPLTVRDGYRLFRPLLDISRATIAAYAQQQALEWCEDDSNVNERFDRNYLRHRVMPLLLDRWPQAVATLGRHAALMAQYDDWFANTVDTIINIDSDCLDIPALQSCPTIVRDTILHHWLRKRGVAVTQAQLRDSVARMMTARVDAEPQLQFTAGTVRRYQHRLYWTPPLPPLRVAAALNEPLVGELVVSHAERGVPEAMLPSLQIRYDKREGAHYRVNGMNRSLKKLLQQRAVPPWLRHYYPVICAGERVVYLPGVGVIDDIVSDDTSSAGDARYLQFEWRYD